MRFDVIAASRVASVLAAVAALGAAFVAQAQTPEVVSTFASAPPNE